MRVSIMSRKQKAHSCDKYESKRHGTDIELSKSDAEGESDIDLPDFDEDHLWLMSPFDSWSVELGTSH